MGSDGNPQSAVANNGGLLELAKLQPPVIRGVLVVPA